MMSALPLASVHLGKLSLLCANDLLDGDLCKIYFIFSSGLSNIISIDALILPISQLQTQQVMMSQIRSHVEYLIQTCADFVVEIE